MNISALFIKRPVGTTLLAIAIIISGFLAFRALPIASLPQMDLATITVASSLPGASPEIMASSIATPLERQFGHIAGISQMTSSSTLGTSSITLQFDYSRDVDGAARDVEAAINAARTYLPANLPSNPTYRKVNTALAPIMILNLTSDTQGQGAMYDTASSVVEQKIAQIKGVGQVQAAGSSLPAVRIDILPQQLNSYGIGVQDVARAISGQNSNRPKGQFSDDRMTVDIIANDQISKAKDYAPLVIASKNGHVVRLSDVATVSDSVQSVRAAGFVNAKPSVFLIVSRVSNANVIDTVDRIKKALPAIRASLPAGDHLDISMDLTTTIRASVSDIELTLLLSILLVVIVVFVFLRSPRSTLIPGVAMVVSLVGTFAFMYLLGFSLNNLSLMALTISTGFVVDDAIVVMENIARLLEEGMQPHEAALQGAKEVSFTVVSMSLSLVAVFVPLLFMGGVVGRLFHEFAYTLTASILVSMVVSLTVTPMMCAYLLKPHAKGRHGKLYRLSERSFELLLSLYRSSLVWALRHPALVMLTLVLALVMNGVLFRFVDKGLFPVQDTGALIGGFQGSQDASFESMKSSLMQIQKTILSDPTVQSVVGFTGAGGPAGASNSGFLLVSLKPHEERKMSASQVLDRLRPKLQSLTGASTFMQPLPELGIGARQSNAAYQYQLSGDSVDDLMTWGPALYDQMRKMPQLKDVTTDQQNQGLQMQLNYDRRTAARLGITPQLIDSSLYYEFGESLVSTIYSPLNQYYTVLEAAPQFYRYPSTLDATYIQVGGKGSVPLAAFTSKQALTSPLAVNHSSFFPSATISFNLAPGVSLDQAMMLIRKMQDRIGVPASVRTQFAGTAEAAQKALSSEPLLIVTALLAIYIVLGILYESLIHPITILSTLPSAGVGAIFALIVFHSEFDVISVIGIFLLIGIVKKNAIMMIDFALQAERLEGKNTEDSIFEACIMRFRPILMTTLAALFAALPLIFGNGTGAELRRPLGVSIAGGLIFSQLITLYTTPVIYLYFDRISQWLRRRRTKTTGFSQHSEAI
ncbi:MMPL family transporter [Granulicella sp. WH15]|uniref:efflux RND transporter permease subunit n=1 Tax=Granulicella sp. WH15 TaxID=2602070 RepID=UPI0013672B34|nr:efflux RND transporter permease subunit [Granulicella sp. WH15]QHN03980.1 MMPL family transporter [Granulicella sp. WH15]